MASFNFVIPGSSATAPLGYNMPDKILRWTGRDKGFLIDHLRTDSWAKQANAISGDVVKNLSNYAHTRNAAYVLDSGSLPFADGSVSYAGVVGNGKYLEIPNAFAAIEAASDTYTASTTSGSAVLTVTGGSATSLYVGTLVSGAGIPSGTRILARGTGGGGIGTYTLSANATATATGVTVTAKNKSYVGLHLVDMPSAADWPSSGRAICAAGNFTSAADLYTIYMVTNGSSKDLVIRPSTAVGVSTAVILANAGNLFDGKRVLIGAIRNEDNTFQASVHAIDGSVALVSSPQAMVTNSADLSGLTWRFGIMDSSKTSANFSASGSWNSIDIGACKWKHYRSSIQSLHGCLKTGAELRDIELAIAAARL